MDIVVAVSREPAVTLQDAADFAGFRVVAPHADAAAARAALERAGITWLAEDHVAVPEGVVRTLAGDRAGEPGWEAGFAAMLAYAASKGWVSGAGIRAHVEWSTG
jgi:hypothetical protein